MDEQAEEIKRLSDEYDLMLDGEFSNLYVYNKCEVCGLITLLPKKEASNVCDKCRMKNTEEINKRIHNSLRGKGSGVYILGSEIGRYKIGKANHMPDRVSNIRTSSPLILEVVHLIETHSAGSLEKLLHHHFQAKHHHGEWFDLDEEDIDWLKTLTGDNYKSLL